MSSQTRITTEIADWSTALSFDKVPSEARRIAKRCILDGLGLIIVGARQECARIVREHCLESGGSEQATILGEKQFFQVPIDAPGEWLIINGNNIPPCHGVPIFIN